MTTDTLSRREAIWLACKPKTCCYEATVIPTGCDVWRISRILQCPPWTFLRYFQTPAPRPDAFALDDGERRFRLMLAKQPTRRKKSAAPCIFLMRSNSGHHRCGLGDLRPQSCRAFPCDLTNGVVCVNPAGCTCRDWSLADVDTEAERALLGQRKAENDEYIERVVGPWNARVAHAGPDAQIDFIRFCDYLLAQYDELAEIRSGRER